jgi:enamine deaminase RidA (YjgF/YER057c/UK114 family)
MALLSHFPIKMAQQE